MAQDNRSPLEKQIYFEIEENKPKTVENKLNSIGIKALKLIFESKKAWMLVNQEPYQEEEASSISIPKLNIETKDDEALTT